MTKQSIQRVLSPPEGQDWNRLTEWARGRGRLVRRSLASAIQVGLAAGLSWWLATLLLPWADPIYAPIGAVVAIGTGEDRMLGRPLRLLAGMLVAVAAAGVIVGLLGSGAPQIVLITVLTTVMGRFLFDDSVARTYSAFHGAVIGALGASRVIPEQLVEAAIGAVVGIVIVHVILPPRVEPAMLMPVQYAGAAARRSLRALSTALQGVDGAELARSLDAAVEVEAHLAPDDGRHAFGRQLVRLSPIRRRQRSRAQRAMEADSKLSSLLLDVAALARLAQQMTFRQSNQHPRLSAAVDEFDTALGWLMRQGSDQDLSREVAESIQRLGGYLDESQGSGRPETMVREALWELSTNLTQVAEDLSTGPRGG